MVHLLLRTWRSSYQTRLTPLAHHARLAPWTRLDTCRGSRHSSFKIADTKLRRHFSSHDNEGKIVLGSSEPLVYPEPASVQHHDLPSFVAYTARSGLDPKSTVYIGTHYEYSVGAALQPYGFSLRRVGGSSDNGIDLLGTWDVPSVDAPLRVLLQCKALSRNVGPGLLRQLEGAFVGAPPGWRGPGVLGFLVSERPATKGMQESMGRSRWPMGYIFCSRAGAVNQIVWNRRASDAGLEGVGVGTVFTDRGDARRLVLTWNGANIPLRAPPSS